MPAIDPKTTDFDIIFVGGINATALTAHLQAHDLTKKMHLKIALITDHNVYVCPQVYFACNHSHIKDQ